MRYVPSVAVVLLLAAPAPRAALAATADASTQTPPSSTSPRSRGFDSLTLRPSRSPAPAAGMQPSIERNVPKSKLDPELQALARLSRALGSTNERPGHCVMPVLRPDPDSIPYMPVGKPDPTIDYSGRVIVPPPCPEPERKTATPTSPPPPRK